MTAGAPQGSVFGPLFLHTSFMTEIRGVDNKGLRRAAAFFPLEII